MNVQYSDNNPDNKSADSVQVDYDGSVCNVQSSTNQLNCYNVNLYEDGRDAIIEKADIDPPEGYKVKEEGDWVIKDEAVSTYPEAYRSELGVQPSGGGGSCSTTVQTCSAGTDTVTMEETGTDVCSLSIFEKDEECATDCSLTRKCDGNTSNQCSGGEVVYYDDGTFVNGSCSFGDQGDYVGSEYDCDCTLDNDQSYDEEVYNN